MKRHSQNYYNFRHIIRKLSGITFDYSSLWQHIIALQYNCYAFGPTMFKSDSKRIQFPLREPRSTELDRQFPGVHVLPSWTCCRTGNLNLVSNSAEFSTPRCPIYIALDRVSQHPTSQPATAVLSIAQTLVVREGMGKTCSYFQNS